MDLSKIFELFNEKEEVENEDTTEEYTSSETNNREGR